MEEPAARKSPAKNPGQTTVLTSAPDVFIGAGGGSHAQQTARIMLAFEELCQAQRPDTVLVAGDVNSTLACSIAAK